MRTSEVKRIGKPLADLRKNHFDNVRRALGNLNIHFIDIDKIYTRKLRNINIVEEILKNAKI